MNKVFIEVV